MRQSQGFTLIELSIVLVIIGLLIGGIVVGKELVAQAAIRSQITQIEQFQLASNTFKTKYGCLAGDCARAAQYGFSTRSGANGFGNGDDLIGNRSSGGSFTQGETRLFWQDLSDAGLISEVFTGADLSATQVMTPAQYAAYFPRSKKSPSVFVTALHGMISPVNPDAFNYFSIASSEGILGGRFVPLAGHSASEAYMIDSKLDDGLPQTGVIMARIATTGASGNTVTALGFRHTSPGGAYDWNNPQGTVTAATSPPISTPGSATTCYDNNNVANATMQYSMSTDGGNGVNCFLSFKMP